MFQIFEGLLSTAEGHDTLSERNFIVAMLRFEASLARAQASIGLIPETSAQSIIDTCKIELFDVPKIVRESARAGNIAIPLIRSLRETVGIFNQEASDFVHFGSCSQDVIYTALALVTRNALTLIETDIDHVITVLLALAERHAADPMLARGLMQPTSVTSFGLKCAGWAAPLVRSRRRLQSSAAHALNVQLGGTLGTLAKMKGKEPKIVSMMAADLNLQEPSFAWHTQHDEWVTLGCELGLLVGCLEKIAKDISLMSPYEVGELNQPSELTRTTASALPHDSFQQSCMVTLTAARRTPQHVAALLAAMSQEYECSLENRQSQLAEWPALLHSALSAARAMAQAIPGLQVNTQRMRINLDTMRAGLPAKQVSECFSPALAQEASALTHLQLTALLPFKPYQPPDLAVNRN